MNDYVTALCARDYKGASVQWASENKFILSPKSASSNGRKTALLSASEPRADLTGGGSETLTVEENMENTNNTTPAYKYIVRRLTPTECERLQAFPDNWTSIGEWIDSKGKKHKPADSNRYKALGNSICTAAWVDILQSVAELIPEGEEKTMASLFDGIGGFPLIWQRDCGGKAVWASEIEEFCIAVTKIRFAEDSEDWKARHFQGAITKRNEEYEE